MFLSTICLTRLNLSIIFLFRFFNDLRTLKNKRNIIIHNNNNNNSNNNNNNNDDEKTSIIMPKTTSAVNNNTKRQLHIWEINHNQNKHSANSNTKYIVSETFPNDWFIHNIYRARLKLCTFVVYPLYTNVNCSVNSISPRCNIFLNHCL